MESENLSDQLLTFKVIDDYCCKVILSAQRSYIDIRITLIASILLDISLFKNEENLFGHEVVTLVVKNVNGKKQIFRVLKVTKKSLKYYKSGTKLFQTYEDGHRHRHRYRVISQHRRYNQFELDKRQRGTL